MDELTIIRHMLADDGVFPNNARIPLLLYLQAVPVDVDDLASDFEVLFSEHAWVNAWRNGIYTFHHYHSTAHEVLGLYRGRAVVQFGGEGGITTSVKAGDVVVIPAGVAHKKLSSSPDLAVVGAYPYGQRWDMNYGKSEERPQADQNIRRLSQPEQDPIGAEPGLTQIWK